MIEPITRESLRDDVRLERIVADRLRHLYWSDCWEPDFYAALAREGFIAIAHRHPDLGPVLIPELQHRYAVLDWQQLHASRNVRRLRASGRLERERVRFAVSRDPSAVMDAIARHHGPRCWMIEPYRRVIRELAAARAQSEVGADDQTGLVVRAVELRAGCGGELVAGELGYTIGRIYTSLSGFSRADDREWNHFGTLQLVMLAERLRDAGYAFWNLGHPRMAYKSALGAQVVERSKFLDRWRAHRDETPSVELFGPPA